MILVQSLYRGDVLDSFGNMDFLEKSEEALYYQKFLEHFPYINSVPVSKFSLKNVKINMKLVVKYLLKYADNIFFNTLN